MSQPKVHSEPIPLTQKVAIFEKCNDPLKIVEMPVTQPKNLKPGEALVKLLYSGVCGTDAHVWMGDWPVPNKEPLIGGHEGAGYVVALGAGTDPNIPIKVGDAVGIKWLADSCLHCNYCNVSDEMLCPAAKLHGFTHDGSFQQYAVSYAAHLSRIPDGLALDKAAPILCAGVTVYKALKESGAKAGDFVVVPGAGGGLGHLLLQYARAMGFRTIGIDTGDAKKKLATSLGAEVFLDFAKEKDLVAAVKKATPDGMGPQAAIVAASGEAAYQQALEMIRPHGTMVAVGLPRDASIKASVFFTVLHKKRIVGSYVGNRADAQEALELAAAGKVECHFKVQPFNSLPEVYHQMHSNTLPGRIVLDLWK